MHLPPCFCNNTVLTYLQIYLHGSLPQGGKAGGRTYLALLNMVEKENEHRCELLLCSPTKLSCFKLLLLPLYPVTQTHHSWVLQGWAAFTSSNRQVGQSSPYPLHPPAQQPQGSRNDANPKLQARQETLLPLSSCTASSFLHPSPEHDMFYSSPSKDSINSFNSFRN